MPEDPTPGTARYGTEGNPPVKIAKAKKHHAKKHHKRKRRHHKRKRRRVHGKHPHGQKRAGRGHR
jgi:hypothetical protein